MEINRNSGEVISEEQAVSYTHSFQNENPNAIKSYFVGTDKLNRILEQEGCIGVRIYDGYNAETSKENRVLVGVDLEGEDISTGVIVEELSPCPTQCPKSSPLIKA